MGIAQVAAHADPLAEGEILSDAVEEGSRELLVEAHVVGAETDDVIGAVVAEAHGGIGLGDVAAIEHHVNAGLGVHVHQSYLVGYGVFADVDDAHLHAPGMMVTDVDEAELRTAEGVGVVVHGCLHATHGTGADIGNTRKLHPALHAHGDIGDA